MRPDGPSDRELASLREIERLLARAFSAADPLAVLREAAVDAGLEEATRHALADIDPRGVRLSHMIVVRLRFERITHGSAPAKAWFEQDPAAFTAAFRAYVAAVPSVHAFPADEAAAFHVFCAQGRAASSAL